jgi:Fic family protein
MRRVETSYIHNLQRFYSMSSQIREERKAYYDMLRHTQSGTMDITQWMEWFLACLSRAIARAKETLGVILTKAKFWEALRTVRLNQRQQLLINRLLDGFEGNLTTVKWAKLAHCSHDTALRDIHDLIAKGVLLRNPAGGRSASYSLASAAPLNSPLS